MEKESLFATFQSLAARRKLLSILATGLPVVGNVAVVSAAFCSKIDEIEDATVGAAQTVVNASAAALTQIQQAAQAALTQIQQAAQDSGAVDRLEDAVDATTEVAGALVPPRRTPTRSSRRPRNGPRRRPRRPPIRLRRPPIRLLRPYHRPLMLSKDGGSRRRAGSRGSPLWLPRRCKNNDQVKIRPAWCCCCCG